MGSIANIKKQAKAEGKMIQRHNRMAIKEAEGDDSHWDGKYHPSMISGCATAAAYQILGFLKGKKTPDAKVLRIFALGTAIHEMLQAQFVRYEMLDDVEAPIAFTSDGGCEVVGHADGIVKAEIYGKQAVLEIKSINSNALAKVNEPKPEHKIQAACYVRGLREAGLDVDSVVFIYYGKDTSEIKEFPYTPTPADFKQIESRIERIKKMIAKFQASGDIPEPAYTAPSQLPCRYCGWKTECHATFERQAFADQMKKEHFDAKPTEAKKKAQKVARKAPKRKLPKVRRS